MRTESFAENDIFDQTREAVPIFGKVLFQVIDQKLVVQGQGSPQGIDKHLGAQGMSELILAMRQNESLQFRHSLHRMIAGQDGVRGNGLPVYRGFLSPQSDRA